MELRARNTSLSARSRWGLSLFGLPFFAVGCVMAFLCVRMIVQHYAARSWVETPAEITFVTMDADETNRVTCNYVYTFEGREYKGDRVGLMGGGDNIGSWQQVTYHRLKQAYDRDQPVVCYVHPRNPEKALLDRELRWPMVMFFSGFVVVFGGVGGAMLTVGLVGTSAGRHAQRMSRQYPDEPWLWNKRWTDGIVRSSAGRTAAVALAFAVFWNSIAFTAAAALLPELIGTGSLWPGLLVMIFPLIGLVLIAVAVRAALTARKFRGTRLELSTFPGVIGGRLTGELILSRGLSEMDEVNLSLRCIRTVSSGETTNRNTLWEDRRLVRPPAGVFGQTHTVLPVDFQIPYSCEPYDDSLPGRPVTWELQARAEIPGIDLDLTFDVPVYRTRSSDPSLGESAEKTRLEREAIEDEESPLPDKIREEADPAGYPSLVSSAWPGVGFVAVFLGVAVICSGVAVFSATSVARHEWFMLIFLIVFGFISLLLWLVLASMVGHTRLTFEPGVLRVARRFALITLHRELQTSDIVNISKSQSASSGNMRWYAVKAQTRGGRNVQLAGMIPGETAARWFVRRVEKLARIETNQN